MKKLLLLLSVLVMAQLASAQAQFSCGTDEAHQRMLLADSNYAKAIQASNTRYAQAMQSSSNGLLATVNGGTKYQIPLVVHVIHTGGAVGSIYNPTDSAIISMIDYLNESYAATYASYPDSSSGGTYFPVEFVLAKRNTSCGYSNGINRINGNSISNYTLRGVNSSNTTGADEATVKALSRWNNHDYYNIWIVNKIDSNDGTFGTYTAGYAYYPGASPTVDGTIMLATTVYAGNITLPHEIGHAFNLRHTFEGDGTGSTCPPTTNCTTTGDLVCDTEPHKRSPFNCPSGTNPCTGNGYNNVQKNFMDYSNCQDRFTSGQKTRWLDALLNERAGLVSSIGSVDTGTNVVSNSCTMTTSNVNNNYNLGPALVTLNDLSASSNGGYSQDNYEVYLDRSCAQRANITQGQSYTLSVKTEGPNAQDVAVYIDYNNNGSFTAGELVYSHSGTISGDETHSTTFSVPTTGITTCTPLRMRVLAGFVPNTLPTNGCGNFTTGGQAEDYSVVVKPAAANITAAISGTNPSCTGTSVVFTVTPSASLTSPSYQWYLNNAAVGTNSATYTAPTSLANGSTIFCKINYTGSCGDDSVQSSTLNVVRSSSVTPAVGIGANPGNTICSGTSVTFTATPTNGGTTPSYQWKLNNVNVGTNSVTYTNTSLANNDKVKCVMTSNDACASPTTATSSEITMSVSPPVTPSVAISANPGTTICSGTSVTFTAVPTNGGTTPTYQWKLNNVNVGTNSTTYTNTTLSNSDVVTCVMTSNASCASPTSVTSNSLTMTVNSTVTPSVAIGANPGTTICSGTSVTFTATPTNGGTTPSYQWKLNSVNVGTNSATYTNTALSNSDVVTCVMTSNATCASPTTATSNSLTMTVNSTVTPSVAIAANPGNTICAGTSVTFTATPTNGGTSPTYQWKLNGGNVGTNSATYTNTTLTNNDIVTCVMTSNATCVSSTTATSNSITMVITTTVTPAVTIAIQSGIFCRTQNAVLKATPTNGGTSPSYQWKRNGTNVGTNSDTFTVVNIITTDTVVCVMTSNNACASPTTTTSNSIQMASFPDSITSIGTIPSIGGGSPTNPICANDTVQFVAANLASFTPTYVWKLNGTVVGNSTRFYTNSNWSNNDTVTCIMYSGSICTNPNIDSQKIPIYVSSGVTPSVSIASSDTTICTGTSVTFTATPTNGGTAPTYQWKLNGGNVGTGGATYTSTTLSNSDVVTCVMTSNASCAAPATATSNGITMVVNTGLVQSVSIASSAGTNICSGTSVTFTATPTNGGTSPTYQWKLNGTNVGINNASFNITSLANNDVVTCVMTSSETCLTTPTATSNSITMSVTPSVTPLVTIAANPGNVVCTGTTITFTATPTNGGTAPTYQWKLNGANVGTGGTTYTNASLSNNDVVSCDMTSNATCASPATVSSSDMLITMSPQVTPSVSIAANPGTTVCTGSTTATFTATPTSGGTNPTYQWKLNGANVGTGGATYTNNSISNNDVVTCVMTSNLGCVTTPTATSNSLTMSVVAPVTPSVSIAVSPSATICDGASVTFTASPANGGTTPTYQWKVNGTNAGTGGTTFTTTTLANSDVVTCVMTSSEPCVTATTANSNSITMTVNPNLTPSVTITPNPNDTVCAGTVVGFFSNHTNGGTPSFQWKVNGVDVTGATNSTFNSATLATGDVVSVVLTSNLTCLTSTTATSPGVTMTVLPKLTPSVVINVSPSNTICAGAVTTFTATPTNGGTTPSYQWKVNGVNAGTNSAVFITNTLSNNDVVSCVMTTSETCVTATTGTSNNITMTVTPNVTPSVAIAANPGSTICAGTSVTFTATPTNGGTAPTYQWKLNGTNVGTGGTTYTTATLTNSDVVTCVMTSNETCATTPTAISNAITMTVNPNVVPSVTVAANPGNNICDGTSVTFTATPTNGGTTPTYQWKLNGTNVGTGGATYTNTALNNNDVITVVMTSNAPCLITATVTSTPITMTVTPNVTPAITIAVAPNNTICAGTSTTFTATPTNGGATPSYQWKVNGTNVGVGGATYTTSTLSNSDVVSCVMTTSLTCVTSTTATSNTITMTVNPNLTPSVVITPSPNDTICAGTSVTFTATSTNGGTAPSYQWKLNGVNVGTGGTTYTTTTLTNGDVVSCVMTSSETCVTSATGTSNSITMTVNPNLIPLVTTSVSPSNTICNGTSVTFSTNIANGGPAPSYQWKRNGTDITGATSATYTSSTLVNNDVITVVMTSSEACLAVTSATSTGITMTVNPNLTPDVSITVSPNDTICAGTQANFAATPTNGGTTPTYQWTLNGANVGTSSLFYSNNTLNAGDVVRCILTSSEACVTKTTDSSNVIKMHVNPLTIPTVSISSNIGTTTCEGGTVVFTASFTNGGTSRSYQWKRNGTAITGATNSTYTTNTLNNSDVITCDMTIVALCPTPATVTSNALTMTVLVPSLSVQVSPTDTICAGTAAMFSLTKNNLGANPQYQWYLNNAPMIGVTADVFTMPLPADGDEVTTIFTGSDNCVNAPRNADTIKLSVTSITTPVATIYVTPDSNVSPGQFVIFNAVSNVKAPSFQWRRNGVDITGETNSTFISGSFADQDTISCLVSTTDSCATASSVLSNKIKMSVAPVSVKQVSSQPLFDDITLSPNPNGGDFYITGKLSSSVNDEDIKVEVINTLGAIVYRGSIKVERGEFKHHINLGDIADGGLHMARLHLNGRVHYIKFITAR